MSPREVGCTTTMAMARSRTCSHESGIAKVLGKAWGVVATDVNNDGWMDLFVANDTVANFLFVNQGKGQFQEMGSEPVSRTARMVALAPAWASIRQTSIRMAGRIFSSPMSIRRCIQFTATIRI